MYNFSGLKVLILHDLKQRELSKNYYKSSNKSISKFFLLNKFKYFLNFFLKLNYFLINVIKSSITKIFIKKKNFKIIIFVKENLVNQTSNFPFYKVLKKEKKNFLIIYKNASQRFKNYPSYNYNNFISLGLILKFSFKFFSNLFNLFNFLKKNNFKNINKIYLFKTYSSYVLDICVAEDIFKYFKPQYIYINQNSLGAQNIIENLKFLNNKIQVIGNSFNGVKLSNQILTIKYLWNAIDHLLCFGELDKKEFLKLNNKKFLEPPKKIYKVGSPRDFLIKPKLLNNKIKKILYIKSNPNMQRNVDEKALLLLLKVLNKLKFKNKIKLIIKDRSQINQQFNLNKIKDEYAGPLKVIKSQKVLTEKLINTCDLIVGTYSTSFIYQSIFFRKPMIQIYGSKIFWCNLKKYGLTVCNHDQELEYELKNFYFNFKKFNSQNIKQIEKLRKYLFQTGNAKKNLENFVKKVII